MGVASTQYQFISVCQVRAKPVVKRRVPLDMSSFMMRWVLGGLRVPWSELEDILSRHVPSSVDVRRAAQILQWRSWPRACHRISKSSGLALRAATRSQRLWQYDPLVLSSCLGLEFKGTGDSWKHLLSLDNTCWLNQCVILLSGSSVLLFEVRFLHDTNLVWACFSLVLSLVDIQLGYANSKGSSLVLIGIWIANQADSDRLVLPGSWKYMIMNIPSRSFYFSSW